MSAFWTTLRGERGRTRKLGKLLALLRPYRTRVILMFTALVIATAASLAPPYLAGRAIDDGIRAGDTGALTIIMAVFLGSAVVYSVGTYFQTYLTSWVGQRALQDLRSRLFAHIQSLSLGFYSRNKTGVVISRLTNDVQALDSLVSDGIVTLFSASLTLIGTAVILVVLDPGLALVTFLVFPVLLAASIAFRIASSGAYRLTREKIASVTAYLQETLSGVRIVRAFGQEPRHERRFSELNDENRDANMKTVYLNAAYFPAVELLSAVATAAILIYGGNQAIDGAVTLGVLASFIFYLQTFFDPIQQLSQLYTTYQSGMAALDKIFLLLDEEPDVLDAPDADELPHVRGRITFEDVSFSYGGDALALCDVDLDIPPGQTVALVGATGAGKSTLAKLVGRFYDATSGTVSIDGRDVRSVTQNSLRSALGIVPQEGLLVLRNDRREHRVRAPGRDRGGDRGRRGRGRCPRVHPAAAGRLRHPGRRTRRASLRRPAPAGRVRPRRRGRPADPDPRRGDVQRRRAYGGRHRARPPAAACRADGDRDRAPAVDDPRRRADRGARPRPRCRAGHARRAARGRRRIRPPVPRLGPPGRLGQ